MIEQPSEDESRREFETLAVVCLSIVWPPTLVNFWFMFWWKATRVESILDIREELMHASTDPVASTRLDENLNSCRLRVWVVWPQILTLNFQFQYIHCWFMFWREATTALLISDTRRARVFLDHSENLRLQLRKNINWESVIISEYLYTNRNIKRSVYCQYG